MRRRRTECSVEIRKQKGADMLMKRRNLQVEEEDEDTASDNAVTDSENKTVSSIPRMTHEEVIATLSDNPTIEQMRDCFESVRRSLSKSKSPPVDEVIKCGMLTALVQALAIDDEKIRFEAAWALTNVVSGTSEQTFAGVKAGATAPLVALTQNSSHSLAEQALWAVANIAGDSAQLRDHVIECHGVEALMNLVENAHTLNLTFVRTISWAFSNMCRHKNPNASIDVLRVLSKGLAILITHSDKQVRQDACWAVSYLTDGPDEQIALAQSAGILPYILKFLQDDSLVAPALRVLGNITTENDELTQLVVDLGTLNEIVPLTERSRSNTVVKECCWLISNIIAGTHKQIQAVLDAGVLPLIIEVLRSGESKCRFEASWAVANLGQGGTSAQIMALVTDGAVPVLCALLAGNGNCGMRANALDTIFSVLNVVSNAYPDQFDAVRDSMEDCGGVDHLERLQESGVVKIYNMACHIVSEFFEDGNAEGDEQTKRIRELCCKRPKLQYGAKEKRLVDELNSWVNFWNKEGPALCYFETIRRSLLPPKNRVIRHVLAKNLPDLLEGLKHENEKIRFEAAWALTNVVSGTSEQTWAVVKAGATAGLVALATSLPLVVAEQALWAVANIAGDSAQLRDHVIDSGGVEALMNLVEKADTFKPTFVRTISWAFSNMCRHKNPNASIDVLRVLSKGLPILITHSDKQVRQDACWAVSYLGPDEQIALAQSAGILPYILKFLQDASLVAPALRVLGNIATGNDELTQLVVDLGTLNEIVALMKRSRSNTVVKECCWLISNIIAGTHRQIQAVLDAGLLPHIIKVLRSGESKCRFEAWCAVANLGHGGTSAQIMALLTDGAVPVLCALLAGNSNSEILANALDTISTLLNAASKVNRIKYEEVRISIEDCGGVDHLERLQESQDEMISLPATLAFARYNRYFDIDELD